MNQPVPQPEIPQATWAERNPIIVAAPRTADRNMNDAQASAGNDHTWAQADLEDPDQPVPYTLTAKAEALFARETDTAAEPDLEAGS